MKMVANAINRSNYQNRQGLETWVWNFIPQKNYTIASVLTTWISLTSPSPSILQSSNTAPQFVETTPSFTILPLIAPTFSCDIELDYNQKLGGDLCKPFQIPISIWPPPSSHQIWGGICHTNLNHNSVAPVVVKICEVAVAGGKLLNVGSNSIVVNNGNSLGAAGATLNHVFVALLFLFEDCEVARGNLRIQKDIGYCAYLCTCKGLICISAS